MLNSIIRKSGWAALALAMLALGTVAYAGVGAPDTLSKRQVKQLLASAKSPDDHLRLAQHYRAEADRWDAEAREHENLAAAHRTNTISQAAAMKNPMAPNTVAHCHYFANSAREKADVARERALSHEHMAQDAAIGLK